MSQQFLSPSSSPANIIPTPFVEGLIYAGAVPIVSTEADLNGGATAQISGTIPTLFGEAISAIITLTWNGYVTAATTYVVMQMDLADGVWIDLNWIVWSGRQGSAIFVMSNGIAGANSFEQVRQSGAVPSPQVNGANQLALGGRIRFVGRSLMAGGSSSLAGISTQVTATIRYRLLGLK